MTENLIYEIYNDKISIRGIKQQVSTLIIPSEIEGKKVGNIYDCAFMNCEELQHVILPESLFLIGTNAFSNCKNLKTIYLPSGLKYIGKGAFSYCDELRTVVLPVNLRFISDKLFYCCKNLEYVSMRDAIFSKSDIAFWNCHNLCNETKFKVDKLICDYRQKKGVL